MAHTHILALDQGTTSSRAILFDAGGQVTAITQEEFKQYYPKSGWVEHDALEIWESQRRVAESVVRETGLHTNSINSIGISNQRETVVLWERSSGRPISRAIVWQDRRTTDLCREIKDAGMESEFHERTGLRVDPYFSATKVKWILDHVAGARADAEKGELLFGTIDSWLLWQMTEGKVHATDRTNASRTLLYNIHEQQWDRSLCDYLDIPMAMLPEVKVSGSHFGEIHQGPLKGIPICSLAGDQQAALFGQNCFDSKHAKNTYGTGSFLLRPSEKKALKNRHRLLTTLTCSTDEEAEYAVEGSVFIAGAIVQWLRDELNLIATAAESEGLALSVPNNGGVFLVPAFAGLGAPTWDASARGTICGLSRGSSAAHICRAALESIAFQSADLMEAINADFPEPLKELRVDGGATANAFLMQFQANVLQLPVVRPEVIETTALGAAHLAGLTNGFWKNRQELSSQWRAERTFEPTISADEAMHLQTSWKRALKRSPNWAVD